MKGGKKPLQESDSCSFRALQACLGTQAILRKMAIRKMNMFEYVQEDVCAHVIRQSQIILPSQKGLHFFLKKQRP